MKKRVERLKHEIAKDKKIRKEEEINDKFFNALAVYCITKELHIKTIYKLCKVPHIDQMLDTMYEHTIKQYKLHEPTIKKLMDREIREELNKELKSINMSLGCL